MLRIHFSRTLAVIATGVCAVVFIMCIFALNRLNHDTPLLVRILFWIMIPVSIWGSIAYVRRLLNPPLMYRADRRGIMLFCDTLRNVIPDEGVFLPWNVITDMSYEVRMGVGGMGSRASIPVIKCTLSEDAPFPVEKHSVGYAPQDGNRVVCLDAFNGHISKQEMLNQLRPLWQASTHAHINQK